LGFILDFYKRSGNPDFVATMLPGLERKRNQYKKEKPSVCYLQKVFVCYAWSDIERFSTLFHGYFDFGG